MKHYSKPPRKRGIFKNKKGSTKRFMPRGFASSSKAMVTQILARQKEETVQYNKVQFLEERRS